MDQKMMALEKDLAKKNSDDFKIGDTVKVYVKIVEDEKTRIQPFEGTVISKKHGRINASFTVRRISYGEGVERTFHVNSPIVEKIEVIKRGKIRRAKLYYLRKQVGKKSKVKEEIE